MRWILALLVFAPDVACAPECRAALRPPDGTFGAMCGDGPARRPAAGTAAIRTGSPTRAAATTAGMTERSAQCLSPPRRGTRRAASRRPG